MARDYLGIKDKPNQSWIGKDGMLYEIWGRAAAWYSNLDVLLFGRVFLVSDIERLREAEAMGAVINNCWKLKAPRGEATGAAMPRGAGN